jgi:hypothetical protein
MTKAEIIREIRRTAAENGGTPLGWRKFATVTGIRDRDWLGRYWARWSDALREAGYEPNELTKAHGESALLDKYAKLSLQFGRLPTQADIRLETSRGLDFPDWKTLTRRFGGKPGLVAKLREYCIARPEYEPVVALCNKYVPRGGEETDEDQPAALQFGFVYLIKHGSRREYKIGRTSNALRREGEIGIELPEKANPIHVIQTDDAPGIEAYWHKRFAEKRKNGEWFELNAADVAAFKRRRFM